MPIKRKLQKVVRLNTRSLYFISMAIDNYKSYQKTKKTLHKIRNIPQMDWSY